MKLNFNIVALLLENFKCPFKLQILEMDMDLIAQELLDNKKSLVRWGDGEISLILENSISYQVSSSALSEDLKTVFTKHKRDVIVAHPITFVRKSLFQLFVKRKIKLWILSRGFYIRNIHDEKKSFANSFGFRQEESIKYLNLLIGICNKRLSICLVTSDKNNKRSLRGLVDDACIITEIIIPSKNSYSARKEIEHRIKKQIIRNDIKLFLMACGPLSKILAYNLSNKTQFIDIGNLFNHLYYVAPDKYNKS